MKHCPRCQGQYGDELAFCDLDGTPLVDGTGAPPKGLVNRGPVKASPALPAGVTALIGILIGIVLCVVVYFAFLASRLNSNESPSNDWESTATFTAPAPPKQLAAEPLPSPSPTAEESTSPEESETSAEAAPTAVTETPAKVAVNQGPISTGTTTNAERRTLITMKDGSSIEADAAWEDAEGVWYRRSGLVSFIDRAKVEKISDRDSRSSPTEPAKP